MFATEIVNVGIIQPHHSVICWIGDIKSSDQCVEGLCRMSVAKTETELLQAALKICVTKG